MEKMQLFILVLCTVFFIKLFLYFWSYHLPVLELDLSTQLESSNVDNNLAGKGTIYREMQVFQHHIET